jgi:hypothetical protein
LWNFTLRYLIEMNACNNSIFSMKLIRTLLIIVGTWQVCAAGAQSGTFAAGSNGQNAQGSLAFSLGEVFVEWGEWDTLQSAAGIQQAYDNSIAIGILENSIAENIQIFPNPCMEEIQVMFPSAAMAYGYLELRDMCGRLCDQQIITAISVRLSAKALSSGMYCIVWVANEIPRASFPLIKK